MEDDQLPALKEEEFGGISTGEMEELSVPQLPETEEVEEALASQPPETEEVEEAPAPQPPETEEAEEAPAPQPPETEEVEEAPVPQPPETEEVEEVSVPQLPETEEAEEAPASQPPEAEEVEETPAPQPPETEEAEEASVPQPPETEKVEEASAPQPPETEEAEEASAPQPPEAEEVEETPAPQPPETEEAEETPAPQPPETEEAEEAPAPQPPETKKAEKAPAPQPPETKKAEKAPAPQPPEAEEVEKAPALQPPETEEAEGAPAPQPPETEEVEEPPKAAVPPAMPSRARSAFRKPEGLARASSVSKEKVVQKLHDLFPDGVIYADQYIKAVGSLSLEIYHLAKQSGLSRAQWLMEQGFVWKELGYVESDMRLREADLEGTDPTKLATYVFRKYPLAGEYMLTEEESQSVYQAASQVVRKVLSKKRLTMWDEWVLVFGTVQLLRGWSPDTTETEGQGTFWNYIFLQFGFNQQKSPKAGVRLYAAFRKAIQNTLVRFRRFFAPEETTQRYYTSLLLHAMAPKQSIEAFFNVLFDFYVKNLDFQYVAEDISYKTFTKGMRARWNPQRAEDSALRLRGDTIFSGLRVLFQERPGYMAVLCDELVKKMDALVRGREAELDLKRNYWDALLSEWYRKKSATERMRAQGERRVHVSEYVAGSPERISVNYGMLNGKVGLVFPKIRLSQVEESRPVACVYQEDRCVFEDELSVMGNDLSLTTRFRFVSLESTTYDFSKEPHLRVEIVYGGEGLYQSGKKLWRDYLLMDDAGNDHVPMEGTVYLFAGTETLVEFSSSEEVLRQAHPGQLYGFSLGMGLSVAVNGVEIFRGFFHSVPIPPLHQPGTGAWFYARSHGNRRRCFLSLFPSVCGFPRARTLFAIRWFSTKTGWS